MSVKHLFKVKRNPLKHAKKTLARWNGPAAGMSPAWWFQDEDGTRVMLKEENYNNCRSEQISHTVLSMLDLVLPKTSTIDDYIVVQHIEDGTGHVLESELTEVSVYDPVLRTKVLTPEAKWIRPYDIVAIVMFDALAMNQDRHGRNALIVHPEDLQEAWRIAPIDHTHTSWSKYAGFDPHFPDYREMAKLVTSLDEHEREVLHDRVLADLKRGLRKPGTLPHGVKAEIKRRIKIMERERENTLKRWTSYGESAEVGECSLTNCPIHH